MGEEIEYSHFRQHDYARFRKHLTDETAILRDWFTRRQLSSRPPVAGYDNIRDIAEQTFIDIVFNGADPETALAELDAQANAIQEESAP